MSSIWCCGSNGRGQLGVGDEEDYDHMVEVSIEGLRAPISQISAGGNHTLLRTKLGQVYSSGDNSHGQCNGNESNTFTPIFGEWVNVSCGWEFSVLLDRNNHVYVCGEGPKGELGLGDNLTKVSKLTKIPFEFPSQIIDIKSSVSHTVVQLQNGELYGWGASRKGQLGLDQAKITWSPTRLIHNLDNPIEIAVGRDFTVLHNGTELEVLGDTKRFPGIEYVDGKIYHIYTMWSSIHVEKDNGLHSFGNNRHGQLLASDFADKFDRVDVGSEHGLGLIGNKVYAWGWGEHGNCGVRSREGGEENDEVINDNNVTKEQKRNTEFLDESFKPNLLFEIGGKNASVYGGCATSWVVVQHN